MCTTKATLFAVPASDPSLAAELMLRHKRITYRRVDMVSALHRALVRALDRVDSLIAAGTIGRDELNAADFQIETGTALLATLDDAAPVQDGRPAQHARRVAPDYPGHVPAVFPSAWLQR